VFFTFLMAGERLNTHSLTNSPIRCSEFERFPAIVAATTRRTGLITGGLAKPPISLLNSPA